MKFRLALQCDCIYPQLILLYDFNMSLTFFSIVNVHNSSNISNHVVLCTILHKFSHFFIFPSPDVSLAVNLQLLKFLGTSYSALLIDVTITHII